MYKKDYIITAKVFNNLEREYRDNPDIKMIDALKIVSVNLSTAFHIDNPKFDFSKFQKACFTRF